MKPTSFYLFLCCILCSSQINAQAYEDYIGAGHNRDIIVTGSHNLQQEGWTQTASAKNTINGAGLEGKLSEAARFLSHAAISHDMQEVEHVAEIGIEAWIDEQIEQPYSLYLPMIEEIVSDHNDYQTSIGVDLTGAVSQMQTTAIWRMNMQERDFLRDKIALSFSEFIVVSRGPISAYGRGVMDYLDIFKRNAFGNFYDIIREISLHPSMGVFLSHFNNPKGNPAQNIFPDENYAREIMQLFTIGLHELNNDGTPILTTDGEFIPTYNNNDIFELAKVFTGLGAGAHVNPEVTPTFGLPQYAINWTVPMLMYEAQHETSAKSIFNGALNIPADQSGIEDIDMVLNYLFNHPNTPPFVCRRLIQFMVKSNPSPAYIERVANVFINDGNGERGNLEAVFKAILLDEEARSCEWQQDMTNGRLKHATEKALQFARVAEVQSESGEVWTDATYQVFTTGHLPLAAPSVFNFHSPDFAPQGPIADAGLVAPEFEILTTFSSVGFGNQTWRWHYLWEEYGSGSWRDSTHIMHPNYNSYLEASQDPEVLINMLDIRLTNGNMTAHTRQTLKTFLTSIDPNFFPNSEVFLDEYNIELVKQALIIMFLSPDYNISK